MDMRNAKKEFLDIIKNYKLIASNINYIDDIGISYDCNLKPLYTQIEYESFLILLDNEYDCGYGGQNLFGVIFCEDGVWMQRYEYDGSESWNIYQYPDMRYTFTETEVLKYERNKKLKIIENRTSID